MLHVTKAMSIVGFNANKNLKPIFQWKWGSRWVPNANEIYTKNMKYTCPTPAFCPRQPIFHWLASGFGVGAYANFRFGVGGLASRNDNFHILDTNMLVFPTQNSGVGGIAQHQPPAPGILRSGGIEALKPIFRCNVKLLALGRHIVLDLQCDHFVLEIQTCWYHKSLVDPTRVTITQRELVEYRLCWVPSISAISGGIWA